MKNNDDENVKPIKPGISIEPQKDPVLDLFNSMQNSFGVLSERDSAKGHAWDLILRWSEHRSITDEDMRNAIKIAFQFEKHWEEYIKP